MTEHAFTVTIDDSTSEYLFAEADAASTSPEAVAAKLIRDVVEERRKYDEWFVREVQLALDEVADPNTVLIPNEVVEAEWRIQRAELIARAEALGL